MRASRLIRKVVRRIRFEYRLRLWPITRRFRKSVTVATKQGIFTLPTDIDDPISTALYVYGEFELRLACDALVTLRNLGNLPRGKGTVLDVGANNGVTSIGMVVAGEFERAIAIEPEPRNFSRLEHNVRQNHLESLITCLNSAVSDSRSTLEFELSERNYGDHRVRKPFSGGRSEELFDESKRQVISVEADTLDNLLADLGDEVRDDISLVWIDVQGYEGYVFLGSEKLLSRDIPVVSEIWPYAIRRAGMSEERFCSIVEGIWTAYWVQRGRSFTKYPIDMFHSYMDELDREEDYANVIFAN